MGNHRENASFESCTNPFYVYCPTCSYPCPQGCDAALYTCLFGDPKLYLYLLQGHYCNWSSLMQWLASNSTERIVTVSMPPWSPWCQCQPRELCTLQRFRLYVLLGSTIPEYHSEFTSMFDATAILLFLSVAIVVQFLVQRYQSGLINVPGPFLASLSNLYRFRLVWLEDVSDRSLRLHRKYGPLLRLGPNYVSASSAESVHAIYRSGTGFQKVRMNPAHGLVTMSQRNNRQIGRNV